MTSDSVVRASATARRSALFVCIPLVGHCNPLIAQAKALRARGFRVAIASFAELRAHVTAAGVSFVDLGPTPGGATAMSDVFERASAARSFFASSKLLLEWTLSLWTPLFDALVAQMRVDRPSVLIADLMTSGAMDAAEALDVRLVVNNADLLPALSLGLLPVADDVPPLFWGRSRRSIGAKEKLAIAALRSIAVREATRTVGATLNQLRRSRGLSARDVHARLAGTFVITNSTFAIEYPRPLRASMVMLGPMLDRDEPRELGELGDWLNRPEPVVYANLGTIVAPDRALLDRMNDAFARLSARVLWTLRPALRERLRRPVASNVRLVERVPSMRAVLAHERVRAFVSHCGVNSAHESLWEGCPIVGLGVFADQDDMAWRVEDAGVGVRLDSRKASAIEIASAIERVMRDESMRARAREVRASFEAAGGAEMAALLIEQCAARE
ncbi:MAG: glycosyltransferase [Polyangiales bacterium]